MNFLYVNHNGGGWCTGRLHCTFHVHGERMYTHDENVDIVSKNRNVEDFGVTWSIFSSVEPSKLCYIHGTTHIFVITLKINLWYFHKFQLMRPNIFWPVDNTFRIVNKRISNDTGDVGSVAIGANSTHQILNSVTIKCNVKRINCSIICTKIWRVTLMCQYLVGINGIWSRHPKISIANRKS